ncbi:hypothetical protein [Paenibacillus mucilaginosus]|uniref:Uncharacterized protein n=3 Tax=Paenibacillus mucilaginosus TaxID=61624 RepID=H6NPM7_9BACL|nr:hypothetical protein [Paenibacillus mucilaginosus]AEI45716.1 hypothetical protein KNP414_07206 [Paenibacillus mucilaginosus KNP414]AFC33383.1 hypothetical protein PM3016_6777 [Paenibacillus mucilaginosus 3016]AFH65693.1 hypothetical protein B2K_34180 [Paenibacillus mucilaginosus K02]MCG7215097.1 hypothetical protein [Paenibacillus mucilaginosus]WDM27103.1 hypothetical protein KCX80_32670 [Paenibacillus mucilaginosus]
MNADGLIHLMLLLLNLPLFRRLFRLFFPDEDDFRAALQFSLTPDLISLLRGRFLKDKWEETRLLFFVISCLAVTYGEWLLVNRLVHWLLNGLG